MGLCHEFGSQIRSGCDHPMRAGASACSCAECGVVCRGLFDGCPDVWARGPRPVAISATRAGGPSTAPAPAPAAASSGGATVTSLPTARTENDRSVRGGAAVAAIGPAVVRGDGGNGAGQRAGARSGGAEGEAADAGAAAAGGAADPRREVFKWFEEAFEGVRLELQTLIASMTHQQAMLAELLDSRQAELRLALVAESLPDVVADAVQAAMDAHNDTMASAYDRSHDRFRDDVEEVGAVTAAKVDSLHEAFQKMASVIAVHDEEAEQRESMRLGTLKGSVTRQITPIAETLSHMSTMLDDLAERVDGLAQAPAASPPAPAAAPTRLSRASRAAAPPAEDAPAPKTKPRVTPARAVAAASPSPSSWAPVVAVGPVVARRVTSNRAAAATPDPDAKPIAKVSPPRKRTATANAAARRRLAQAAALPDPEPEPEPNWAEAPLGADDEFESGFEEEADDGFEAEAAEEFEAADDAEPEFEPEPEPEPVPTPVRPRRITTRRPAGVRSPAAVAPPAPPPRVRTPPVPETPPPRAPVSRAPVSREPVSREPVTRAPVTRAPAARIQTSSGPPNGSTGPAHDAARRGPTARVTAPRASSPTQPTRPPEPPASRRVLGRRQSGTPPFQPPLKEPSEPLVSYELEDDARELFGIDDDDEGWAPPAWVAEAAAKRQAPGRGRTPR